MKIVFAGGRNVGLIGLLTAKATGHHIVFVMPSDKLMEDFANRLDLLTFFLDKTRPHADLFVSVHCRTTIPQWYLDYFPKGGINVHPCLWKYKGADPVGRLLSDGETKASVGIHRMTEKVDKGEVLWEEFVDVTGCKTREEVYNKLYPLYAVGLVEVLRTL